MKRGNGIDNSYIEARESLIYEAEKHANKECGKSHGKRTAEQWARDWNMIFHSEMERLVAKFFSDCKTEWIIGSDACRSYIGFGSWKGAKIWIKKHNAPLRYWIDGRPVFLKKEIDEWLKSHSALMNK